MFFCRSSSEGVQRVVVAQEDGLLVDLFKQDRVEVIVRKNNGRLCQGPFAVDIGIAEVRLVNGNLRVAVSFEEHVCPVACIGVERATVVEYDGVNLLHLDYFMIFLLPIFTRPTPMKIHTSSRILVKKLENTPRPRPPG